MPALTIAGSTRRGTNGAEWLAATLLTLALALLPGRPAWAQTPARDTVDRDSANRDSVPPNPAPRDSARRAAGRYVGPHGLQGVIYGLVLAPAWIPQFLDPPAPGAPTRLGYWRDHASLSFAGGGAATPEDEGWAGSAAFEVLRGCLIAEARLEHFRLNVGPPVALQYRSARVGRLSRPNPGIAAGVMLGYRDVRGPRAHDGVEVAFPFIGGGPAGWVRLEAAYVVSLRQSSWNYRAQWQRRLGGGPFFAGLDLELKAWEIRRRGELSHATLGAVFGTTFRGR